MILDAWLRAWRGQEDQIYVDVEEYVRKKAVREAEYQQAIETESKVLRTSRACRTRARRRLTALREQRQTREAK